MPGALAKRADHRDPHELVDANRLPVTLKITPGQAHDGKSAADMLETIGEHHILLADAA